MRYSGPAKRRREAGPGRIPPLWATRPTPGGPLWPPRYPPLGSPYFVPFLGGGPPEAQGACVGPSAQASKKDKAKIVQFEWNGCTFYRYIPDGTKGAAAAAVAAAGRHMGTPGEPPIPPPPFGRPRSFEWHQRSSRSQSRRRKQQQVFPPRAPAPPWTPGPLPQDRPGPVNSKQFSVASAAAAAAAAAMGAPGGGTGPYRPREPNPRIPRKENKAPASHMHLPPFLATTSSKAAAKSPSPTTATHVQGPPRAAAFRNKDSAAAAPLPFSLRAAFGAEDCCASPASSKRNETPGILSGMNQASGGGNKPRVAGGGNVTVRRSHDAGVPESDVLGAKPKKPPRMSNMTFTKSPSERSAGNAPYNGGNSKAFARAPPFRNSPRVYSSTVLKDFSSGNNKQENARGAASDGRPLLSVPRESTPKEQRTARQDRRVRYKAEIVGSNIIVTREEPSPEKKSDTVSVAAAATDQKAALSQTSGSTGVKKVDQRPSAPNGPTDTPKAEPAGWKDREESAFQSRILHAALLHGTNVADAERSSATVDAFTQLTSFDINEQFDRFLSPGPRCKKQEKAASMTHRKSPSGVEWCGKLRSISVQTDEMAASTCERKHENKHRNEILDTDQQEQVEKKTTKDVEAQKEAKPGDNIREPLSEGEEVPSPASYVDEPHTSSSEIYLDSLVSNGTSTSSPRDDAFRKPGCDKNLNSEGAVALLSELDDFLKECSPIKGAQQPAQEQPVRRSCGSSTTFSEGASRNSCPESVGRATSSSPSSLSKGDGFSDISEPRSPLAKDLQVPDNASLASDVILINFAEDTTTLKEHLDGLVADYKAKQESDTVGGTGIAFSPGDEGCRPRSASSGTNNVLEKHPGSSPTRSSAPVLLPSDVSPRELLKMASEEARAAGGDFRSSSLAKEPPQTQKDRVGEALSERGDSSFKITRKSPATGTIEMGRQRSLASCDSCGTVYSGSINSENFPRVCSCKTRHGARAKGSRPLIPVEIEEALKEEYRDPEIVSCFVEENVQYLLESEDEEYEQVVRRRSLTGRNLLGRQASQHDRSGSGSDERSAVASQRYPENSTSWNKIKDASEASVIGVAGTERCGSEATTGGASRALIYDCPWWTYDQGGHDGDTKGDSISAALGSCDQISANNSVASAVAEIASNAAATLHPWSTTLRAAAAAAETGVHGTSANGPGAVGEVPASAAASSSSNNPWGPFLATAQAIVGPKREAVMSSGDHETADEIACRLARSDADFTTLYMEGQPRKPTLKQRWPPSAELGAAVGPPGQHQRATGGDRDSLSFYEFPLNDQHEALPPQQHSLSMETLVGSNRLDVASVTSTVGGTERRLAEGEPMPPPADAIDGKPSGGGSAQSPDAQYCELELYVPVSKSGPAVCAVVAPSHSMAEGDGAKGEAVLLDTGPRPATPPEDSGLCGDKKIAETSAKPMGKIRTRFRDFFWKHK
ncbi:hypothetical protein HPB49_002544 [Dermacentor silvarum]|uniref:Uncharacterized protein n=1 Tax=Dermacentor silvarum TaxID=543639 RepID=A0ACB8CCW9_DERSI|nr:uncharacterized protein LOC119458080 [Dermacentor silvarum]KAH7940618.1 hypothetical protein HPB49_002544 [Dermacentor silvarum]